MLMNTLKKRIVKTFFSQIVTVIKEISDLERWMDPGKDKFPVFYFLLSKTDKQT